LVIGPELIQIKYVLIQLFDSNCLHAQNATIRVSFVRSLFTKDMNLQDIGLFRVVLIGLVAGLVLGGCKDNATSEAPAAKVAPLGRMAVPVCLNEACGVVDETGKIIKQFTRDSVALYSTQFDSYFLVENGAWAMYGLDGAVLRRLEEGASVNELTPGLFAEVSEDKSRSVLFDAKGKDVFPEPFEELDYGGRHEFIVYQRNGLYGIINAKGEMVTPAQFDELSSNNIDLARQGGAVAAAKGKKPWVVLIDQKIARQVPFTTLDRASDGYIHAEVLKENDQRQGLLDLQGNIALAPTNALIGHPSPAGMVFFKKNLNSSTCGFMDLHGKVLIPAQFSGCSEFGAKSGAASTDAGYGLIDHTGKWLVPPHWITVNVPDNLWRGDLSARSMLIAHGGDVINGYTHAILDLDQGKVLFENQGYTELEVLDRDHIVFSREAESLLNPAIEDVEDKRIAVGLMDPAGKVLIPAKQYFRYQFDASRQFIVAFADRGLMGLHARDGRELVPAKWPILKILPGKNAVVGFDTADERDYFGFYAPNNVKALYRADGQEIFSVRKKPDSNQEELVGPGNRVIWPAAAKPVAL
jgi:hypothetical protein